MSLVEPGGGRRCGSKVVVEMTNRVDWEVVDVQRYWGMMREIVRRGRRGGELEGRVVWVANNRVEGGYLERGVGKKVGVRVLRPLGVVRGGVGYPEELPRPVDTNFVARAHYCGSIYTHLQRAFHIPLTIVPAGQHYGGPEGLLRFKAFIDFPYQYSVMKFYENIAAGVPQFVPTPRLLKEVLESGKHCTGWISIPLLETLSQTFPLPSPVDRNPETFPAWSRLMDYYDPLFAPYVYYFDSIAELTRFSRDARVGVVDERNVRETGRVFYEGYREEILEGWREVFFK
ncbi:hypothetical protein HDU98_003342 [Podochytrium sp. JEL0797]|nr:hypothetical protein HDU98_003342 [Podochytrium sp. JEL0797]